MTIEEVYKQCPEKMRIQISDNYSEAVPMRWTSPSTGETGPGVFFVVRGIGDCYAQVAIDGTLVEFLSGKCEGYVPAWAKNKGAKVAALKKIVDQLVRAI